MQLRVEGRKEGEVSAANINPIILKCTVFFVRKHGESLKNYVAKTLRDKV